MKKGTRKIAMLLAVMLVMLTVAACGKGNENNASSSPAASPSEQPSASASASAEPEVSEAPKEVVTLKITMFADWYLQGWQAIEQDVNANAEKLGFKLDIDKIAGGEQGIQILQTRAATNDLPDILAYPSVSSVELGLHINDKLMDMTGWEWTKNYDANVLGSGNYGKEGKVYGLPLGGSNIPGVFYNKKVFSELGLSVPTTWEEFLAVCEAVKAAGKTPYFVAGKDPWTVQIFNISGWQREFKGKDPAQVMGDINTNKLNVKDLPLFKDSYAKLKELKDKGYFQKNWLSDNYDAQQKAIAEGTAAMTVNATWILDEIKKKFPDKINDVGAFVIPFDGDDPVGAWPPNAVFGISTSEHAEAVKAFLEYFGSLETQTKYFAAQPSIPLIKGISVEGLTPAAQELYAQFNQPGRGQTNWQALINLGVGSFDSYSMDIVVGGKTPDEVMEKIRKEMEKDAKVKNLAEWNS